MLEKFKDVLAHLWLSSCVAVVGGCYVLAASAEPFIVLGITGIFVFSAVTSWAYLRLFHD